MEKNIADINKNNKDIGFKIKCLSNLIKRLVGEGATKKTIDQVTGSNGWIIGYIHSKNSKGIDVYQRDIEEKFDITRSTVSKVVNLMVKKGLIERQSVESDARLKKLVLTNKSIDVIDMLEQDKCRIEDIITKGFSKEELDILEEYINRMQNNVRENLSENINGGCIND